MKVSIRSHKAQSQVQGTREFYKFDVQTEHNTYFDLSAYTALSLLDMYESRDIALALLIASITVDDFINADFVRNVCTG